MKSIQHFIQKAFFYFAAGLISLAVVCIGLYGIYIYQTNKNILEQTGYNMQLQTSGALRSTNNNILITQSVMKEQVEHGFIDKDKAGLILASTINYNPNQYTVWFALSPEYSKKMKGSPKGQILLVLRKKDKFEIAAQEYAIQNFQTPFLYENYDVELYNHDVYYKDLSLPWYQIPIQEKDKIIYTGAYRDEIYGHQWLFTYAKTLYDSKNKLIGVVGIDFAMDVIRKILSGFIKDLGVMVVQAKDGLILFDIPEKSSIGNHKDESLSVNISKYFGSIETLEELYQENDIKHAKFKDKWVVLKTYKTISGSWYFIVYQNIWTFYKGIVPFFLIISSFIIAFLGGLLYFLQKNKQGFLKPFEDLLNGLKRDIRIIGSNKSFSGQYPESDILEINELVECVNALIEVVNENFKNYRIELEKNVKTKEELELLVQIRSEQLIEREKLAALGFMSAGLAHEIKNPLNLICNAAEIINMQLEKLNKNGIKLDEQGTKAITRITESNMIVLNNGLRVDNIIKTLLLQVRNTKEGHEHLVDMGELIRTNLDFVLANYRPKLNNRIKVTIDQPENKTIVRANPVDLGRVFINIFDNSCYAMIKKINTDENFNADLKISIKIKDQGVEITVRDNGTGISKTDLTQVFTPFYTTKPPGEGTGLGLNFVYEIIKQHGGSLEIQSKEGEYTEIIIYVPYKGRP